MISSSSTSLFILDMLFLLIMIILNFVIRDRKDRLVAPLVRWHSCQTTLRCQPPLVAFKKRLDVSLEVDP